MPSALLFNTAPTASFDIRYDDAGASWSELIRRKGRFSGSRIETEGICTSARVTGGRKTLPPMFTAQYLIAVNDKIRCAIESLEPGVHQFLPFSIRLSDDQPKAGYFLMNICHLVDAIVPERTNLRRDTRRYSSRNVLRDASLHMTLNPSVIAGMAIWYDRNFTEPFVADQIAETLRREKVTSYNLWAVQA